MTDLLPRVATAMSYRRQELIAQPLSRIWEELAKVAIEAMSEKWKAEDLIAGRSYESIHFGIVTYMGVDDYLGSKTHEFDVGRGERRYWRTEALGAFLKPKVWRGAHD